MSSMLVGKINKLFNSPSTISLVTDWVKTGFQIEALTPNQNITENRLRHARGPVQFSPIPLHLNRKLKYKETFSEKKTQKNPLLDEKPRDLEPPSYTSH